MAGADRAVIDRQHVARKRPRRLVGGRWQSEMRIGSGRQERIGFRIFYHLPDIDQPDRDRLMRTTLDAGGGFADRQPVRAHVALADDPQPVAELRHLVRTRQDAILAPETGVGIVPDNPGDRVLLIGIDRAGDLAGRFQAMVTGTRDMLHHRLLGRTPDQQPHFSPCLGFAQRILRMTGGHAGLAARTTVQIHLETKLLPLARWRRRKQHRVVSRP